MARKSAEVRREEIVGIALRHFAEGGFHGTSTEAIAREAGISQPYLFRLFRTKRELFLACADRCFAQRDRRSSARRPRRAPGGRAHDRDGRRVRGRLLPDRHMLLFQMQAYATSDPEIRAHVRAGFNELRADRRASWRASRPSETWDFFAYGMMLNVTTALDIPRESLEVIFRHRRAIAWGSLVLVLVAAVFALPVFGELGNENDFDDPSRRGGHRPQRGHRGHGRVRGAEHRRARAARRAGRERAGARRGSRAWRGALRASGRGVGGGVRARRRPPARLPRRPLDLPAGDVQGRRRGRADAHRAAARATCRT